MLRALSHRNFRLYLFGLVISLIGTYMQQVAEGWLVYRLSNSALALGLVGVRVETSKHDVACPQPHVLRYQRRQ